MDTVWKSSGAVTRNALSGLFMVLFLACPHGLRAQEAPAHEPSEPAAPAAAQAASAPAAGATAPAEPRAAPVLRVLHVPPTAAPAEEDLTISVGIEASHLAREIALYVRPAGTGSYERLVFRRQSTDAVRFAVSIPGAILLPGAIEYYIASLGIEQPAGGRERLHFASPNDPHTVIVLGNTESRFRRDLLAQHRGNRSRLQGNVEYVNFGRREALRDSPSNGVVDDFYWRAELDYTYRFLGLAYSIRLGAGLLLGQTYIRRGEALLQIPDAARCDLQPSTAVNCRVGLYYGFAELRFRLGRLVRLDVRPILGVGPSSFDGGGGGQLIIGHDPGTHVGLGIEGVSNIGVRGWLRLAWDTVPRVPMAFTLDLENFPNNDALAMRLMITAGYRFGRHFGIDVTAGYATRGWQIGGPTAGLKLVTEF